MERCAILIVDDDAKQLEALRRCARGFRGLRVVSALSSKAAISEMAASKFDAAVVDLLLGTESGVELIATLRSIDPEMRIVAVTATASPPVIESASRAGAEAFLPKPFTLGAVAKKLALEHDELRASYAVDHASLERVIWDYVHRVHDDLGGNKLRTARALEISPSTLKRRLGQQRPNR